MKYTYPTVTEIDIFYTNSEGYLITPEALKYGKGYSVVEVQAPYGYILDSSPMYFNITAENTTEENGITIVKTEKKNAPQKGTITVEKTGEIFSNVVSSGEEVLVYQPEYSVGGLAGAVFEIYADEDITTPDGTVRAKKDTLVDTITTGKNGTATSKDELIFYMVQPTNISVLSHTNIEIKVRHLMMVLSAVPDIEITCTDSCECFDTNKSYIKDRIDDEHNEKVRKILAKDLDFLDSIQTETSTARQFLFIARCKSSKSENVLQKANRVEKIISDQGFEVTRMSKSDIKRFLAIYFEASMNGDLMPDYDGEQYFEKEYTDEKA